MRRKPAIPEPPSHLSEEAAKWWRTFTDTWELDDASLLILETSLEAFDRMRDAQKQIKEEGATIKDRFGQTKQHPACLTERDSRSAMLRGLKSLGLDLEPLNDRSGRPPGR